MSRILDLWRTNADDARSDLFDGTCCMLVDPPPVWAKLRWKRKQRALNTKEKSKCRAVQRLLMWGFVG